MLTYLVHTLEPVLRGHCIKGSPALSSHFFFFGGGSVELNHSGNEPVLKGHLS